MPMTHYKTKLEAYEAGADEMRQIMAHHGELELARGIKLGIAQERARAKKKLDRYYNRPLALKERVDREAEAADSYFREHCLKHIEWKGLGNTKQPSLWKKIISALDIRKVLP